MTDATGPIDPIHSAMMLGMTPEPCEPVIEITRQAVTKLLDVVEFGDQLERVEKERLVAFVKDILAQDQPELWATYSPGPGEVHPCMTKEHAEREAKATIDVCEKMRADQIARHGKADFWPTVVVDVIPSPFTPLEHFELLAEETIQHRDDLVEYVGELKNKLKDTPEPAWRPLIRLAMNLLNLRNHVPGSDVDLCVKALADLLEGKHSPAPEPSEAWREVAELAQAEARAMAMPAEISRGLLGKIVDEVFGGAIEDASVIEDIYRVIARASLAAGDLLVHPKGVQNTSHPALIALDKQCRDDVARALGLTPTAERDFAWSYLLARVKEVVADAAKSASAIAEAKAWCDENGGTPAEFLSHQLLVKRCEVLGRPLTWHEAIELTALTTSMPDDERDKLLALDDEPGGDA